MTNDPPQTAGRTTDDLSSARLAERRMQLALWASGQLTWEWDSSTQRIAIDHAVDDSLLPPMSGGTPEELFNLVAAEDRDRLRRAWALHARGVHGDLEVSFRVGQGDRLRWVMLRGRALSRNAAGHVEHMLGTLRDVTAECQAEASLELMAHAFASTRDALTLVDEGWHVLEVNEAMVRLVGVNAGVMPGADLRRWIGAGDGLLEAVRADGVWRGERDIETLDEAVPVEMWITPVHSSGRRDRAYLVALHDLRESREQEQRLRQVAMFDPLTGLPNRLSLQMHLERTLATMQPMFGLLLLDLDGFKEVNDSYGHDVGDLLLQAVGQRLRSALPESAMLARLDSDEFAVVLGPDTGDTEVRSVAQVVLASLAVRFEVGSDRLSITPTLGAVLVPQDGNDYNQLIRKADAAMHAGKARGRNCLVFYDGSLESDSQRRVRMSSLLRVDTERNAFAFVAQPKVDGEGIAKGVELLIRWHTEAFGMVSPVEFIPLAERLGLIQMIGRHAMHAAAQLVAESVRIGRPAPVAVNLSPKQLLQPGLDGQLMNACRRHGVEPALIELELTESALVHSMDVVRPLLGRLRQMGFTLALDDFGTGFSSLSYLRHLPFHKVKIDRSFVMDADRDTTAARMLESIVRLCGALGMSTVAEGVETPQQLEVLRSLGVQEFQGYYFAKPMPGAEWIELLAGSEAGALQLPVA